MVEIRRCYDCGNWFDDPERKKYLLCPKCRTLRVNGKYIRDPIPELELDDLEVIVHCELPRGRKGAY